MATQLPGRTGQHSATTTKLGFPLGPHRCPRRFPRQSRITAGAGTVPGSHRALPRGAGLEAGQGAGPELEARSRRRSGRARGRQRTCFRTDRAAGRPTRDSPTSVKPPRPPGFSPRPQTPLGSVSTCRGRRGRAEASRMLASRPGAEFTRCRGRYRPLSFARRLVSTTPAPPSPRALRGASRRPLRPQTPCSPSAPR